MTDKRARRRRRRVRVKRDYTIECEYCGDALDEKTIEKWKRGLLKTIACDTCKKNEKLVEKVREKALVDGLYDRLDYEEQREVRE